MTRVAAIDCGTNSIRLLVADLVGADKKDVHREMRVVRLGQGVDETGALHPEALERTRAALAISSTGSACSRPLFGGGGKDTPSLRPIN